MIYIFATEQISYMNNVQRNLSRSSMGLIIYLLHKLKYKIIYKELRNKTFLTQFFYLPCKYMWLKHFLKNWREKESALSNK